MKIMKWKIWKWEGNINEENKKNYMKIIIIMWMKNEMKKKNERKYEKWNNMKWKWGKYYK